MYDEKQLRQQTKSMLIGKLFSEEKALAEAEARLKEQADGFKGFIERDEENFRAEIYRLFVIRKDLEARLAAAEAGADGAHCVHDDCWLHGSHLGDAKRRIASLELELMRMTNDVDHRVADLETRLAAAEQRHIEPMAGCSCSACTQLRERGRS